MQTSEKGQNILLWWSLIFGVIFGLAFYFLLGMVPPPPATLAPAEIAAFYAGNAFSIKLGAVVASWTAGFLVPFSAVIAAQLARLEQGTPIWSILSFGGGLLTSIFLVVPPILWGVAAFTASRLPEITATVNEVANIALVTTDQYYIFLILPIAFIGLTAKPDSNTAFPRWFCWLSLFFVVVTEAGALGFMFKSGPFAWNGLFVFWIPFGMFCVWLVPAYYCLFAALKRQAAAKA